VNGKLVLVVFSCSKALCSSHGAVLLFVAALVSDVNKQSTVITSLMGTPRFERKPAILDDQERTAWPNTK